MNGIQDCLKLGFAQSVNQPIGIEKKRFIVYKITNIKNSKIYIGQTAKTLQRRKYDHIYSAYTKKAMVPIHCAMRKYGIENFDFKILYSCSSKEEMIRKEIETIDLMSSRSPNGYNLTAGGEGLFNPTKEIRAKMSVAQIGNQKTKGQKRSIEFRQKISKIRKGIKASDESRKKNSEAHKGQIPWITGRHHTDEAKEKISKVHKGKSLSEEHKRRLSKAHKGKKKRAMSEEGKANIRAAVIGRKHTAETKAKMSSAHKRRKQTVETRAKLRAINLGKKHTPEAIAKMMGHKVSAETRAKISATHALRKPTKGRDEENERKMKND